MRCLKPTFPFSIPVPDLLSQEGVPRQRHPTLLEKDVHKSPLEFFVMWTSAIGLLLACITNLPVVKSTTTTTQSVDDSITTTSTAADNSSGSVPVVEIIIIAFGLLLLLFVAVRMATLVRQYGATAPNPSGMFLPYFVHIHRY